MILFRKELISHVISHFWTAYSLNDDGLVTEVEFRSASPSPNPGGDAPYELYVETLWGLLREGDHDSFL